MIYKYLNRGSLPTFLNGDIIEYSNLVGCILPQIHLHFVDCNLAGVTLNPELHTHQGCLVCPIPEPTPEPEQVYPELAANAEIVLNALKGSGKLSPEQITGLEQLASMVKAISKTDAEIGEVATQRTLMIVNTLKELGYGEFASQVEQAMLQIQSGWEIN